MNRVTQNVDDLFGKHEPFLEDDKVAEQEEDCFHYVDLLVSSRSGHDEIDDVNAVLDSRTCD